MLRRMTGRWLVGIGLLVGCSANNAPLAHPTATPNLGQSTGSISAAVPVPTALPSTAPLPAGTPLPAIILPTRTPYPDDVRFSIGESVEGQDIWAWQFGQGEQRLVLVGGIHGGYEANSTLLAEMLVDHYRDHAEDIIPGVQLTIIPAANPDGLTHGSDLDARFNTNGVDLNRNWGCAWEPTAFLRDIEVSPGPRPFSEPETQALRTFFIVQQPSAVIFYHSAIGAVYMGACGDHPAADWMGDLLAEATGYPYQASFDYYEVSGDATDWLAERGIPAATVELVTRDSPEFDRNLRGVQALQCALAEENPAAALSAVYERLCQQ